MKILVMSLLRLGDILLATPVLRGLREKFPDAEIHLLINSQFAAVGELIPFVDRVRHFDREALQNGLGEAGRPLFEPYERMREIVKDLNAQHYDRVYNLTHNRLSGWLMNLIESRERIGLSLDENGRPHFGSPWFRYLNTSTQFAGDDTFHFIDVFRHAAGLGDGQPRLSLMETASGRAEAEGLVGAREGYVAVQPLTSDAKKDWGLAQYQKMLKIFSLMHPAAEIFVLGAPAERERLEPMVNHLQAAGVNATLAICSIAGAFSLLRRASVLISGDTSIKHLACATRARILELSLGSSDWRRTGAYVHDGVILQSQEACAPCPHSSPCHRRSHACGLRISADCVALTLSRLYTGADHELATIAQEYRDQVLMLRTHIPASGYWAAYPVGEPLSEAGVGRWLDLSSWRLFLDGVETTGLGEYGSESYRLSRLLRRIHPDATASDWVFLLDAMEKQAESIEVRIMGIAGALGKLKRNLNDPRQMRAYILGLISLRERLKGSPFLRSYLNSLEELIEDDRTPPFVRSRRIVDAVQEMKERTRIELKLIRVLQNQMEESA